MASSRAGPATQPAPSLEDVRTPSVMELWRAAGGERVTYSEIAWIGTATAIVAHAALHFFSAAIYGLERFLVVFQPPESAAFALTEGGDAIATWLVLLAAVGVWGAVLGAVLLAMTHAATALVRNTLRR